MRRSEAYLSVLRKNKWSSIYLPRTVGSTEAVDNEFCLVPLTLFLFQWATSGVHASLDV